MSEYWKSNPKKFCDFCKCWIADNKTTIALHEQGQRHKDSVQTRLNEIKKKTVEKRAEDKQYNSTMAAIEKAAMKSMEKDLEHDPSLKKRYGTVTTAATALTTASLAHTKEPEMPSVKKKLEPKSEKRKVVAAAKAMKEEDKPRTIAKIGEWQPIEKKIKLEMPIEPIDLQLPIQNKCKQEPVIEKNIKIKVEVDNQGSEKDTTRKPEIIEKVVTLNSSLKNENVQFKKRTNNQQSSRQRNDD